MSDAAFKTAAYPGYTTAELGLMIIRHEEGRVTQPAHLLKAIKAEIGRRAKVAAGDTSVMTDGERLRQVRESDAVISKIADKFADVLREWLTVEEFAEMKRFNETPEYATQICASQDVCDANMAMHEAIVAVTGKEPNVVGEGPEVEEGCRIWNAAWELARERHIGKGSK